MRMCLPVPTARLAVVCMVIGCAGTWLPTVHGPPSGLINSASLCAVQFSTLATWQIPFTWASSLACLSSPALLSSAFFWLCVHLWGLKSTNPRCLTLFAAHVLMRLMGTQITWGYCRICSRRKGEKRWEKSVLLNAVSLFSVNKRKNTLKFEFCIAAMSVIGLVRFTLFWILLLSVRLGNWFFALTTAPHPFNSSSFIQQMYSCPHNGCNKVLKNKSGLMQHIHAKHGYPLPSQQQQCSPSVPVSPPHPLPSLSSPSQQHSDHGDNDLSVGPTRGWSPFCWLLSSTQGNSHAALVTDTGSVNTVPLDKAMEDAGDRSIVDFHPLLNGELHSFSVPGILISVFLMIRPTFWWGWHLPTWKSSSQSTGWLVSIRWPCPIWNGRLNFSTNAIIHFTDWLPHAFVVSFSCQLFNVSTISQPLGHVQYHWLHNFWWHSMEQL